MQFLLSLHTYADWGLLALRLAVAAIFLAHGTSKFGAWKQPAKGLNGMMRLLSLCEPLGAVAIFLGVLTQPAALGLALVMLGAIYFKITKWNIPFSSSEKNAWEFDLLILASCLLLLFTGAGTLSVDRMWFGL
jgi:putative oxidoreductase